MSKLSMRSDSLRRVAPAALLALVLLAPSCAPGRSGVAGVGPPEGRLPPVPEARGELRIDVVYPAEDAQITTRDRNFIFGNVGRGDATLTIDGAPVEVAPNGAWLAYLPVPQDGRYQLSATAAGQTVTATRTVRLPTVPQPLDTGGLQILEGSVTPTGVLTGVRGEPIEVRFRGSPGAQARLLLPDGTVVPLFERPAIERATGFMLDRAEQETGIVEYVGTFALDAAITSADPDLAAPTLTFGEGYIEPRERQGVVGATLELVRGGETVRLPLPAGIGVLDPMAPRVAIAATARPDSTVIGRRQLGADQAWDFFWPNGTRLVIDGETGDFYRVRLAPQLSAWVARADVQLLDPGTTAGRGFVGPSLQVIPREEWLDVRFATSDRQPFRVEPGEWGLSIEFFGVTGRPLYVGYGQEDPFLQRVDWEQPTDDRFRFNVRLNQPLWGYRYHWEGNALVLQVRRPPPIDPARPLSGLRIAVDAGHRGSPGDTGAIGPTRLTEVEATLAVTRALVPMLRQAGAEVVEIRPEEEGVVPLIDRPILADRNNAHLFASVHFNAFPDGVNPFENHGTIMFYYWPHSLEFARHLQREVLAELGLPDRGVRFQNLAIPRTSWMPSVLTESLFMMFPEQEAALRDPRTVQRIAAAHFRAMESFVRDRAPAVAVIGGN
jgi:N-acetylmuramoyl-L-alanine amidase